MKLILLKPHTHGGRRRGAGDDIDVPAAVADMLIQHGVAERAAKAPSRKNGGKS